MTDNTDTTTDAPRQPGAEPDSDSPTRHQITDTLEAVQDGTGSVHLDNPEGGRPRDWLAVLSPQQATELAEWLATATDPDQIITLSDEQQAATGIDFPGITECPDCGHSVLEAIVNNRDNVTLGLDGDGGISHREQDHPIEETYSQIQCPECGAILVEDAEIVHEALTD